MVESGSQGSRSLSFIARELCTTSPPYYIDGTERYLTLVIGVQFKKPLVFPSVEVQDNNLFPEPTKLTVKHLRTDLLHVINTER